MDTSNSAVVDLVSPPHALSPAKRQYRSAALKRQIVEATLVRGASVARVARAYGVNANQVYAWRHRYQQGRLQAEKQGTPALLAVQVAEAGAEGKGAPTPPSCRGAIQVELPKGHRRLTGDVDRETLRVVLEALLA